MPLLGFKGSLAEDFWPEAKTSLPPLCEECFVEENPEYRVDVAVLSETKGVTNGAERKLVCVGCANGFEDAGLLVKAVRLVRFR